MTEPRIGRYPVIKHINCPNGCGWFRDITDSPRWEQNHILHLIYGNVPNYYAAKRDIERHDCEEYLRAKERIRPLQEKWNVQYPSSRGNNRTKGSAKTD